MSNDELNKLDFNKVGIIDNSKDKESIVSLKELGVKAISNYGVKGFILALSNGKNITSKELFNIMVLDNKINKADMDERDRFYRKINVSV